MQAERYSDRSIAVFGDTKPYSAYLKDIGGKYNSNLRGRPGWIFTNDKESAVLNLIEQASAGQIQGQVSTQYGQTSYQQPVAQMVSFNQNQPAMNITTALSRLATNKPKPVTPLQSTPSTLNFPNRFTAADNLSSLAEILTIIFESLSASGQLSAC